MNITLNRWSAGERVKTIWIYFARNIYIAEKKNLWVQRVEFYDWVNFLVNQLYQQQISLLRVHVDAFQFYLLLFISYKNL